MQCPSCSFQNPHGLKFCGECGKKLERSCPKCNSLNPPAFKFCGECGFDFRSVQETIPQETLLAPRSYTPKHLADKILNTRSAIEGERKIVTVLFADVTDYTSLSETRDPEDVHRIMDGCFKILMDEIHKYECTINQFTGDGVMALFGTPVAHENHAQRACLAAIAIQDAIEQYSRQLKQQCDVSFRMRVGINSGPVVVGSIGDDLRMDYTAIGDTTNLAARMENAAAPGAIWVSENTRKQVKNFFELEFMGEIAVKGKKSLQKAFRLIKSGEVDTRFGASVAKGLTRFVGRKRSLNILIETFEKAWAGSGQVIAMAGEPGVGKSRLLLEMRNRLEREDFSYFEGRCLQYGGSIFYLPVLDILRTIFEINDGDTQLVIKTKIKKVLADIGDPFKGLSSSFQDILSVN